MSGAIATYKTVEFTVAEDPWGQVASWRPAEVPHLLIAGKIGGGPEVATTAAVQALAAQCARAHWAVYIVACHDDSGYRELRDWPNVRCVATRPAEQIAAVTDLQQLLQQRLRGGDRRDAPVVLLIDSWHQLLVDIAHGRGEHHRPVLDAVDALLRLGRGARIHVVMAGASRAHQVLRRDSGFCVRELCLRQSPYLDGAAAFNRKLGSLRPIRSSYSPLDKGDPYVVDYPITTTVRIAATSNAHARPVGSFAISGSWGTSKRAPFAAQRADSDIEVGRYAVRTFTIDRRRGALVPASIASHLAIMGVDSRAVWEGGVCVARCALGRDHSAPSDNCSCGIYGATSLGSLRSQFPDLAASIVAVVAAEGPTVIGSAGLRTCAARVVAYWCHPGSAFDDARAVLAQQCTHAQGFDDLPAMLAAHDIPATAVDSNFLAEDASSNMHSRLSLGSLHSAAALRFWSSQPGSGGFTGHLRRAREVVARRVQRLFGKSGPDTSQSQPTSEE